MFDDDDRRLVQVASIANAIGAAENAAPWRALIWLAGEVEGGRLAARLFIPVRMRTVGTTRASPDASLSAWRSMAKRAQAAQTSPDLAVANRDSFMPAAASTWHVHVNDLLQFVEAAQITDAVRAELRELAQRYRGSVAAHSPAVSTEPGQGAAEAPAAEGTQSRHGPTWQPVEQMQAQPVRAHRTGRDLMAPVIDRACAAVADGADSAQVMAELERLARLPESARPPPLVGADSGGVQWRDGGAVKKMTRKALGARLRRRVAPPR